MITWVGREYLYDVSQGIAQKPLNERLTKIVKGNNSCIIFSAISAP